MFIDLRKKQEMDALIARVAKLEKKIGDFEKNLKSKTPERNDSAIKEKKGG